MQAPQAKVQLQGKRLLFIGTGNMAQPVFTSLLAQTTIQPSQLTLIAGSEKGATSPQKTTQRLAQANVAATALPAIISYEALVETELPRHDIIIFGAKPEKLGQLAAYTKAMQPNATVISIAAGKSLAEMRAVLPNNDCKMVRTMPQLSRGLYALYGEGEAANADARATFSGMGEGVMLSQEDKMHDFTAHFGCGPAFLARMIQHSGQTLEALLALLENQESTQIDSLGADFIQNWLALIHKDFGPEGARYFQIMMAATATQIQESELPLAQFIENVRSPNGVTNAGLLCMGSASPSKGDNLAAQQAFAKQWETVPMAQAIGYAIKAAKLRSRTIAQHPKEALAGLEKLSL